MRTLAYYRQQAAECRAIAKHMSLHEHRDRLLKMAAEWDRLADDREVELRKQVMEPRSRNEEEQQ